MQLIFDKNTANQRAVDVDFFGENLFRNTLNASYARILADGVTVPDLSTLRGTPVFKTLDILDGNTLVPVQGSYNIVMDASAAYNSSTHQYTVTIILGASADVIQAE